MNENTYLFIGLLRFCVVLGHRVRWAVIFTQTGNQDMKTAILQL